MRRALGIVLAFTLLGSAPAALADVPPEMSVQGRLTNNTGNPVPAGLKVFTFKIFDSQTGGTEIWPAGPGENQTLSTDANGLWNGCVGNVIPLTEAVFQSPTRWLQVTVNDGINPPETLSRIELKTNPYTYRAATSQQADSLGGQTLNDLMDKFVDEVGDTMTGQLLIDYPGKATSNPGLHASNVNDGHTPSLFAPYTFGLAGDAASDGPERKFGSVGIARGADGDAIGVIGEAHGSGDRNIAVWGFTSGGASVDNYSGLFEGGDFRVISPVTPGTGGVQLPADAIDNTEILDEPGLAAANDPTSVNVSLTSATTDIETVSITTPSSGYIRVVGNVYSWITGNAGDGASGFFQIDETAGGGALTPYFRRVGTHSKPNASIIFCPVTVERIYFKSAGTYTFRLEGAQDFISGIGDVLTIWPILTATFYPTAYGTVSTVVSSSEAGEFQAAEAVVTAWGTGGAIGAVTSGETMYEVDLRELELRVVRADLEAARAREEFHRAMIDQARTGGSSGPTAPEESKP